MYGLRVHAGIAASVLVLVMVGVALAAAGCGGKADASGAVKLTDADNGKAVTVKVGDTVQVILSGNPTTGYSWSTSQSTQDAAILPQQGAPVYAQQSANSTLVGGGGTYTFTYKALAPGQVVLKYDYARPFEKGVAPIKTYSATVTVQ